MEKAYADGTIGIQTQDRRMVGAGKSTELWQPPMFKKDAVDKTRTPVLWCLKQLLCQLCHNIYPESLAMTVRILADEKHNCTSLPMWQL